MLVKAMQDAMVSVQQLRWMEEIRADRDPFDKPTLPPDIYYNTISTRPRALNDSWAP